MAKSNLSHIHNELKKWLVASQKLRTTSSILHAKIKSHLAIYETKASREEITQLQSEMGNLT